MKFHPKRLRKECKAIFLKVTDKFRELENKTKYVKPNVTKRRWQIF